MQKIKRTKKPLTLRSETVRALTGGQLERVFGGIHTDNKTDLCGPNGTVTLTCPSFFPPTC